MLPFSPQSETLPVPITGNSLPNISMYVDDLLKAWNLKINIKLIYVLIPSFYRGLLNVINIIWNISFCFVLCYS